MAARPLPSHEPERTPKKDSARTAATTLKQRFLEIARSLKEPAFQNNLRAIAGKRWFRIAGIVVAAFIVLLIALPFLINVNSFRPKIESAATTALGRQVKLGDLSLSLLSGTVGVENIDIADDPAFSKSSFVTAKSLRVGVELMPLIFSKQLNVTGIALNEPQITLLKAPNGEWNFATGPAQAGKIPLTIRRFQERYLRLIQRNTSHIQLLGKNKRHQFDTNPERLRGDKRRFAEGGIIRNVDVLNTNRARQK